VGCRADILIISQIFPKISKIGKEGCGSDWLPVMGRAFSPVCLLVRRPSCWDHHLLKWFGEVMTEMHRKSDLPKRLKRLVFKGVIQKLYIWGISSVTANFYELRMEY